MKKSLRIIIAGLMFSTFIMLMSGSAYAATTKVTADACKVRANASTSSDVVASVTKGQVLEIVGSTTADDGYTWYQVKNGGGTGYIRADLVDTPDGTVSANASTTTTNTTQATPTPAPTKAPSNTKKPEAESKPAVAINTTVTESEALKGVVNTESVSVRSGASTATSKAGSAKNGQEVSISGEATDNDGKKWYQVSFLKDDKEVKGFIRSDFLEITEVYQEPVVEEPEPVAEEPEPVVEEPQVPKDYEVIFEANGEGTEEWFLYDHLKGTKQSINNIYAVMQQSQDLAEKNSKTINTFKIVIIVLAVVLFIFVIIVTVLLFKLRDASYYYGDDDEEEDDEDYSDEDDFEEIEDEDDLEDDDEDDDYRPKRKFGFKKAKKEKASRRRVTYDLDDEEEEAYEQPVRKGHHKKRDEDWSTSGMLDIDDDMEFEFLDLED